MPSSAVSWDNFWVILCWSVFPKMMLWVKTVHTKSFRVAVNLTFTLIRLLRSWVKVNIYTYLLSLTNSNSLDNRDLVPQGSVSFERWPYSALPTDWKWTDTLIAESGRLWEIMNLLSRSGCCLHLLWLYCHKCKQ